MKKLSYVNKQWNVTIHKDNINQVNKIDVVVGFNYGECDGGADTHIGTFGFEIVRPAILDQGKSTFDLNALANMLQSLQENPNSSDELVLQTHLTTHNNSQDLNKIKAFLELLTAHQECQQPQSQGHPALQDFINLSTSWNLTPIDQTEQDLAKNDSLAYLDLKLQGKTDQEVYDLYAVICSILSNHNCLPAGHPKLVADFAYRAEVIADIVSLITPIVAN